MLTVTDSRYFRVGDVVRMSNTGEAFLCSGSSVWRTDTVKPAGRWLGLWRFLTGRPAFTEPANRPTEQHTLRVWKWRPSPLPRRLP